MKKFEREIKKLGFERFGEKIWMLNEDELNVEICYEKENLIIVRIKNYDLYDGNDVEINYEICRNEKECIDLLEEFLVDFLEEEF